MTAKLMGGAYFQDVAGVEALAGVLAHQQLKHRVQPFFINQRLQFHFMRRTCQPKLQVPVDRKN